MTVKGSSGSELTLKNILVGERYDRNLNERLFLLFPRQLLSRPSPLGERVRWESAQSFGG